MNPPKQLTHKYAQYSPLAYLPTLAYLPPYEYPQPPVDCDFFGGFGGLGLSGAEA